MSQKIVQSKNPIFISLILVFLCRLCFIGSDKIEASNKIAQFQKEEGIERPSPLIEKKPLYVEGEMMVKFKENVTQDDVEAINKGFNATIIKKVSSPLLLNSEESEKSGDPDANHEFDIEFQHTLEMPSEKLSIYFVDVEEDSRCLKGVKCVWEGNARIVLDISKDQEKIIIQLNSSLKRGLKEVSYENYKIHFLNLFPYPEPEKIIKKSEYRVRLRIESVREE